MKITYGLWDTALPTNHSSFFKHPIAFTGQRLDYLDDGDLLLMYYKNRYYVVKAGRYTVCFQHLPVVILQKIGLVSLGHSDAAVLRSQTRCMFPGLKALAPGFHTHQFHLRVAKKALEDA